MSPWSLVAAQPTHSSLFLIALTCSVIPLSIAYELRGFFFSLILLYIITHCKGSCLGQLRLMGLFYSPRPRNARRAWFWGICFLEYCFLEHWLPEYSLFNPDGPWTQQSSCIISKCWDNKTLPSLLFRLLSSFYWGTDTLFIVISSPLFCLIHTKQTVTFNLCPCFVFCENILFNNALQEETPFFMGTF